LYFYLHLNIAGAFCFLVNWDFDPVHNVEQKKLWLMFHAWLPWYVSRATRPDEIILHWVRISVSISCISCRLLSRKLDWASSEQRSEQRVWIILDGAPGEQRKAVWTKGLDYFEQDRGDPVPLIACLISNSCIALLSIKRLAELKKSRNKSCLL